MCEYVHKGGKGLGMDKHVSLYGLLNGIGPRPDEAILRVYTVEEHYQKLLYVFRNDYTGMYYLASSSIIYDHYLNFLQFESGQLVLEEDESEEDIRDYEDRTCFHLPLEAVAVMAGDVVDWLQSKIPEREDAGINYAEDDEAGYVYR